MKRFIDFLIRIFGHSDKYLNTYYDEAGNYIDSDTGLIINSIAEGGEEIKTSQKSTKQVRVELNEVNLEPIININQVALPNGSRVLVVTDAEGSRQTIPINDNYSFTSPENVVPTKSAENNLDYVNRVKCKEEIELELLNRANTIPTKSAETIFRESEERSQELFNDVHISRGFLQLRITSNYDRDYWWLLLEPHRGFEKHEWVWLETNKTCESWVEGQYIPVVNNSDGIKIFCDLTKDIKIRWMYDNIDELITELESSIGLTTLK